MSDQVVNIKLVLNAEGIQKVEGDLQRLNKLKQQAERMSTPVAAKAAGYSGSEYGTARGTIGTGAEGRDFAKQSQGLGGLVRLYATVAANIFAVSAAFNALKEAMATTNMIEGLNQLGAQSGQALGTLAKNFADASGGAISLRDAMQATVQATSAGLSTKQFTVLGEVAKKASLALGRDMSDSVSRLTRGITKLEPELLDELGIFAKVGKATEDYAKSVGKTVEGLTDFEKRQAFANAVLKEGIDKFGSIDIPANPYDKLLASLKNLAQTGLEVVNKVLGPLIDVLSKSPAALTAGIAALSAMLVKQALPAIGQYRAGLLEAAENAKKAAQIRAGEASKAVEASAAAREAALDKAAEKELQNVKAAAASIEQARTSGFGKASKAAEILKKKTQDVTQAELDYLTKVGQRYKDQGKDDIAGRYARAVSAITASAQAEKAYQTVVDETTKKLTTQQGAWTALGRAQMQAKRTADIAASKGIVSGAAENTAILGMGGAWTEMRKQVKESDMGPVRKAFTTVSGAASIASTAIMGVVGAFQTWLFIIGGVIAAVKMFDAYMTKNADQTAAFNASLDASNEAVKGYDRTLKALSKMDGSSVFSAAGVTAQANAFRELTDSLTGLREKFEELEKATTGWDKFWDGVFSKSQGEKFAEASVSNISKLIAGIDNQDVRSQMTKQVNEVLGTKNGGQVDWLDALKKGGPEAAAAIKQIEDRLKPLSNNLSITASRSKEFNDSLTKLTEAYREFAFSAIDKSPMTKLGDEMVSFATKTVGALADTETGLASMTKLLQDNAKLGLFTPEIFAEMSKMKSEVEALNKAHGETASKLRILRQEEAALQLEYDKAQRFNTSRQGITGEFDTGDTYAADQALAAQEKLDRKLAEITQLVIKDTAERKRIAEIMASPVFRDLAVDAFVKGAELITRSLELGFAKASVDLKKGILGSVSDLPGSAALQREVDKQDIGIQRAQLEMSSKMLQAQYLNVLATKSVEAAVLLKNAKERTEGRVAGGAYRGERSDSGQPSEATAQGLVAVTEQMTKFVTTGKGGPAVVKKLTGAMKEFGSTSPEIAATLEQMLSIVKSFQSIDIERAGLGTKDRLSALQYEKKLIEEQKTVNESINSQEKAQISLKQAALNIISQQNSFQTEEQIAAQKLLSLESAKQEYDQQGIAIAADRARYEVVIAEAKKAGLNTSQLESSSKQLLTIREGNREADKSVKTAQAETTARLALIKALSDEETRRLNILQIINETNAIQAGASIESQELELEYYTRAEKFSAQQIADAKAYIDALKLRTETESKLNTLNITYLRDINKLVEAYRKAAPGEAGDAVRADVQDQMTAISAKYTAEVSGIKSVSEAKMKLLELDSSLSERQKAYGEVFKNTFAGMADAIVSFVKTGKLDFGSLIDSMLADLLRYELRLQALAMYQAMRPGLMSFVGSLTGGSPYTPGSANFVGPMPAGSTPPLVLAKGGAFDYGIEKFAMGGAFTNQIVDSPTLFKFAKGTGMMGEAGPEAIMPLQRDASGNLGVRAGQQQANVDVVVNNYSGEQATTNETTDSRGNRRIEVTIGEMSAGELNRSGSASQKSMRNTYGIQPQLIRR